MGATTEQLLEAGVHFGHLTSKWNPKMAPYIFMEQNGIHIIDLNKTASKLDEAQSAIANIARTGRKVMFVATKKQAKEIIEENAKKVNMPFVSQRWLGGMLTNFATVRKSIKKMQAIEKMKTDGTFDNMNKKERLMKTREQEKLIRVLGGIEDLNRLPAALFVVDVKREHIAVKEAQNPKTPKPLTCGKLIYYFQTSDNLNINGFII
ncbi:MAG: 30S ribosomal protein S2 [Bacteroidia bacterium]